MVKSSEMILFLYLHFSWLYGHKIIKEFWKNIHFWKYDNCFSSDVSKLTSVRNELNLPLKYWFMEAKDVSRICYCHKFRSKYQLNTKQTTFSENDNWNWVILLKIIFCHVWKCIISGLFHRSKFLHLWKKPAIIFSKWLFFKKSLVISWAT